MEIEAPPSSPELAAATAEHEKMMTDHTHPQYEAFRRGDKAANDYVDGLYRKAVPNNKPIEIGKHESVSGTTDFSEDARASIDVDVELRRAFGDRYETTMSEMAHGAQYLFNGDEGQSALTVLSDRIAGLGPKAEALGVKFLADLSKLHTQGG